MIVNKIGDEKVRPSDSGSGISKECKLFLLCLGLLLIGFVGYITLRGFWVGYIFAHLGALGIVGLLGIAAGAIAKKKGRDYWKAFKLGLFLSICGGIISVLLVYILGEKGTIYCGGSVSLIVAILIIFYYSLIPKKTLTKAEHIA
ncbi:MAG: hypothetical protein GY855_15200 [candidate division Zixibacteria bacterium]|nr:hypothetical protein [candidate division Zixibacteria bacterium]